MRVGQKEYLVTCYNQKSVDIVTREASRPIISYPVCVSSPVVKYCTSMKPRKLNSDPRERRKSSLAFISGFGLLVADDSGEIPGGTFLYGLGMCGPKGYRF